MEQNNANPFAPEFMRIMRHPLKSRMFIFWQLPAAFFSGVRIRELNEEKAVVTIPYQWFSKNPFRSTYFACLAMAAEMSTGLLAMMQVYKRKPAVSMLVIKIEASYYKKATGITAFTCNDGKAFLKAVNDSIANAMPQTYTAMATGVDRQGDTVAVFNITWSFKARI